MYYFLILNNEMTILSYVIITSTSYLYKVGTVQCSGYTATNSGIREGSDTRQNFPLE